MMILSFCWWWARFLLLLSQDVNAYQPYLLWCLLISSLSSYTLLSSFFKCNYFISIHVVIIGPHFYLFRFSAECSVTSFAFSTLFSFVSIYTLRYTYVLINLLASLRKHCYWKKLGFTGPLFRGSPVGARGRTRLRSQPSRPSSAVLWRAPSGRRPAVPTAALLSFSGSAQHIRPARAAL